MKHQNRIGLVGMSEVDWMQEKVDGGLLEWSGAEKMVEGRRKTRPGRTKKKHESSRV